MVVADAIDQQKKKLKTGKLCCTTLFRLALTTFPIFLCCVALKQPTDYPENKAVSSSENVRRKRSKTETMQAVHCLHMYSTAEAGGPIGVARMAFYFDHYFQIWTSEAPKSLFLFPDCIPSAQETEENKFYQVLYIFGDCSISFPLFLISFPPTPYKDLCHNMKSHRIHQFA